MTTDTTPEAIAALLTCITAGRAVQFHPDYCPEADGTPFSDWDTSHHVSVIRPDGSRYRIAEFRHSAEAAFHCAARDLVPALSAEVAALKMCSDEAEREVSALRAEIARLTGGAGCFARRTGDMPKVL